MKIKNKLAKALSLVAQAFEEKLDRGGYPLFLHCLAVMQAMDQDDEELMCIAVFHDFPEETGIDPNELLKMGFSMRVVTAVELLTHDKMAMDYDTYIRRLSVNEDCKKVKRADLDHNSRITRLKGLRRSDFDRLEKYSKAYTFLANLK